VKTLKPGLDSTEPARAGPTTRPEGQRRPLVARILLSVALLVAGAELLAAPLVSWRTAAGLTACGAEGASVDLGARPHLWALATGHVDDVRLDIDGLRIGPLRVDQVTAQFDGVDFERRRLVGMDGPLRMQAGTATATVTESDLDELVDLPLSSVQVTDEGVFVVLLGAPVEVLLTPAPGHLELRVADETVPAIGIDLPAGVEVTDVEAGSGILSFQAELASAVSAGDLPC